jgi:hypothetical protein
MPVALFIVVDPLQLAVFPGPESLFFFLSFFFLNTLIIWLLTDDATGILIAHHQQFLPK